MANFPPPPVNTIDWSNVGFKVREGKDHPPSFLLYPAPSCSSSSSQHLPEHLVTRQRHNFMLNRAARLTPPSSRSQRPY